MKYYSSIFSVAFTVTLTLFLMGLSALTPANATKEVLLSLLFFSILPALAYGWAQTRSARLLSARQHIFFNLTQNIVYYSGSLALIVVGSGIAAFLYFLNLIPPFINIRALIEWIFSHTHFISRASNTLFAVYYRIHKSVPSAYLKMFFVGGVWFLCSITIINTLLQYVFLKKIYKAHTKQALVTLTLSNVIAFLTTGVILICTPFFVYFLQGKVPH